jgi:periplasmic protein TonB
MGFAARVATTDERPAIAVVGPTLVQASPAPYVRFESLVQSRPSSRRAWRWLTPSASLLIHAAIIAVLIVVPVLLDDVLPDPDQAVRAFFVSPRGIAPPPPPPPPPAAGVRAVPRAPVVARPAEPPRFVAPVAVPDEIVPEPGLDLGTDGGVPGGVEGGVPGGVVGGIVGGLPAEPPPAAPQYVRIGGNIKAPKLVHDVKPEYPLLAQQARVQGIVVLEAQVDADGRVQTLRILRSIPLLDDAAMAAVRQWRYKPLLLNGQPMPFVLSVTVSFRISQ